MRKGDAVCRADLPGNVIRRTNEVAFAKFSPEERGKIVSAGHFPGVIPAEIICLDGEFMQIAQNKSGYLC